METQYLAHFGIKGMKWGVRCYQNPDGSLTAAGRERYGVETIAKGSTVRRVTAVDAKGTSNKAGLYTYGTASANSYEKMAGYLPSVYGGYGKAPKKAKVTQYEFTKDAKLLPGKAAVEAYMKDFGDVKVSRFLNDYGSMYGLVNGEQVDKIMQANKNKTIYQTYRSLKAQEAMVFAHGFMHFTTSDMHLSGSDKTNIQRFAEKFKDLGYDAIIDPEDYTGGFTEPILVINPEAVREQGHYKIKI